MSRRTLLKPPCAESSLARALLNFGTKRKGVGVPRLGSLLEDANGAAEAYTCCQPPRHHPAPTAPPCVTFRLVVAPLQGPGQSPILPFACCVGPLLSVGRCGRCS